MNYNEKYQFAKQQLSKFQNFLEIGDFRRFLLLILNLDSGGPESLLKQFGMGGAREKMILPYDPVKKIYYQKIMSGLSQNQQLLIYHQSEKLSPTFLNDPDSIIFTQHLSAVERKNSLPGKFILLTPEIIDYAMDAMKETKTIKPVHIGIESLFPNLAELIASQTVKYLFLLEGDKADILFSLNIQLSPNQESDSIQYFDVFVDEERKHRKATFIQMQEKSLDMNLLEEIKDFGHSKMFESHFTIIVPVKSFKSI